MMRPAKLEWPVVVAALAACPGLGCGDREAAAGKPPAERPVLAEQTLLDGRRLVLTARDDGGGPCLVLSGLDEHDRQCGRAPSARRPVSNRAILAGPTAQRDRRSPLEVYGETSDRVDQVRIGYRHRGRRYVADATLLRADDANALRRAGIERPFGFFVAELPAEARDMVAHALRRNQPIGHDDYRDYDDLHPHGFIAASNPLRRRSIDVRRVVGRSEAVRVPVRIRRRIGLDGDVRRSYIVSTDSAQPQAGCVTRRSAFVTRGAVGAVARVTLDEADGEGGGSGWCPGPYLGTVVYAAERACPRRGSCPSPSGARLVARFAYEVR